MYYRHFGLNRPPFQFTPSTTVLYLSESHRECLAAMEWALLHEPCGLMLLVGETGTGKTTLLNAIIARQFANLQLACVANPKLSFEEIMLVVLAQLGATITERGRLALIRALESTYANQPAGHRTAIVIDEAQDLSDETLEDLRLLTNQIGSNEKGIQFVLMGQPELVDRLSAPHLRQFRERIGVKALLAPLNGKESIEYIKYCLNAVNGAAQIFEEKALRLIVDASAGIPRRLNILCHNALLVAYSEDAKTVTLRIAREVIKDYASIFPPSGPVQFEPSRRGAAKAERARAWSIGTAAFGAVCVLGVSGFLVASEHSISHDRIGVTSVSAGHDTPAAVTIHPETSPTSQLARQVRESSGGTEGKRNAQTVAPILTTSVVLTELSSVARRTKIQIHAGETLQDLAVRYLGSIDRTRELIVANPQIRNPDLIYPGETVYLPSIQSVTNQE